MPPDDPDEGVPGGRPVFGFDDPPSPTFTLVLTPSAPGVHGLELTVGQADFQRAMDRGDIVHYVDGPYAFEVVGGPVEFRLGGGSAILALGTTFTILQSTTFHTVRPDDSPFTTVPLSGFTLARPIHTPDHSTAGLELPPERPAWVRNAVRAVSSSLRADGFNGPQIQRVIELLLTPGSGIELAQAPFIPPINPLVGTPPIDDPDLERALNQVGRAIQFESSVTMKLSPKPRRSVWDRLGDDDIE